MSSEEDAHRLYLSEIMRQLTESARFRKFFFINYDVKVETNEEDKSISVQLIERPPELAQNILHQLMEEAINDRSKIVTANMQDLAQITKVINDD